MKRCLYAVLLLIVFLACPLWAQQTLSRVYIVPGSVSLKYGTTQQFKVVGLDAAGNEVPITYPVRWMTYGGSGQIMPDGLFVANSSIGKFPKGVQVIVGSLQAFASVEVFSDKPSYSFEFERNWGAPGPGQFHNANGMAYGSSSIYIADTYNHRIQRLTNTGTFMTQWGNYGSGNAEFKFPRDVTVAPNGYVYVADTDNHRIQVFDPNGGSFRQFGTYGSLQGQLCYPSGVAVASDGYIYVADTNNHRIQKFNSNGTSVLMWGSEGSGDGQFEYPTSVAVFYNNVYVIDLYNYRVQKFDLEGKFIAKWGSEGTEPGQFSSPQKISVTANGYLLVADGTRVQNFDSNGKLVVVYGHPGTGDGCFINAADALESPYGGILTIDSQLDRVQEFTWQGNFKSKWGVVASPKGELRSPQGVAVDVNGYVYASDTVNGGIQKFDRFGQFVSQFGTPGSGPGALDWPSAITVDTNLNVYVIDGQQIVKFDEQGDYVTRWGSYGTGHGQLKDPQGIAVDALGNVYVADTGNDRIQKFGPSGNFISTFGTNGSGPGPYFNAPVSVAIDSTGSIYVLDRGNARFVKFDSNGFFILEYRVMVGPIGQLSSLALDPFRNVFLTDTTNHVVRVFSYVMLSSGPSYQAGPIWGVPGSSGAFSMLNPSAIAFSRWGHMFIADTGNNRIKKLALASNLITIEPSDTSLLCGSRQDFTAFGTISTDIMFPLEGYVQWSGNGKPLEDGAFIAEGTPASTSVKATYGYSSYGVPVQVQLPKPENGYIVEKRIRNTSYGSIESIDIGNDDSLYVLSRTTPYAVRQYSPTGKVVEVWGYTGKQGGSDPSFAYAVDMRVDSRGNLYVLDNMNCTISKFDRYGNLLKKWGAKGSGDGQMSNPQSMALDSQGNIYISDTSNNRIQKFSTDGKFITKWGAVGNADGQFRGPNGIVIGPQNTVYVADTANCRIQEFDSDGRFISKWGSVGPGDGQFAGPKGVAVDSIGNVIVADTSNNRIQKFDSSGNFITKWGKVGSGDGQFLQPTSIAVDNQGAVYVADFNGYRIQKFIQCSESGADLKKMPDGTPVSLISQGVTAGSNEVANGFYAESPDRSSGILVTGLSADRNSQILVRGVVQKAGGECTVKADQITITGQIIVSPLGMNISQLGGGSFGYQDGAWGWRNVQMSDGKFQKQWIELSGLNNIGLLVKVWGKIITVDSDTRIMLIDDNMGNQIKCLLPSGVEPPTPGVMVSLTGISSCEYNDEGNLVPVLKLRDVNDLLQLAQ